MRTARGSPESIITIDRTQGISRLGLVQRAGGGL